MYLAAISQFHLKVLFASCCLVHRFVWVDHGSLSGCPSLFCRPPLVACVGFLVRGEAKERKKGREGRDDLQAGLIARNYPWRPISSDWLDGWSATSPRTRTSSNDPLSSPRLGSAHAKAAANRPRFQNPCPPSLPPSLPLSLSLSRRCKTRKVIAVINHPK